MPLQIYPPHRTSLHQFLLIKILNLQKIKKYGNENIYYIFIVYKIDNRNKSIIDVQIAPFYKFLGLNSDGLLKYREKDGNLRPKDFDEISPIKSFGQFKKLFEKTVIYRSRRIIKKHQR